MVDLKDTYRYYVGAYYGIREMDEYKTKEYILKEVRDFIDSFISDNPIDNFNYEEEARLIEDTLSLKTKLQDALIVLNKIDGPLELILLIKERIKNIEKEDGNV